MSLEIRLGRSDVEPVAGQRDAEDRALGGERRKDLALDGDGATLRHEVEHLGLEHVQAGVDEIGVDLLRPRLLEERLDAAVRRRADEPVAARIGDGSQEDRRLRARRTMERDHLAEIGLAQRVAVQGEEAALEAARGERDAATGAEWLVLDRIARGSSPCSDLPKCACSCSGRYPHASWLRSTPCRARCSKVYASNGRSTSGSMSLRVRSVSGRSLVPCPPTRMTAGRLTRRAGRCPRRRTRAHATSPDRGGYARRRPRCRASARVRRPSRARAAPATR